MKFAIVAILLIVSSAAMVQSSQVGLEGLKELWSLWKQMYEVEYEAENDEYRFWIFVNNYQLIEEFNSNPDRTSTVGLNQFANLTSDEFQSYQTGLLADQMKTLTLAELEEPADIDLSSIPASFDWRDQNKVTPVKNQGQCGSCWAFSTVGALESLYLIENDFTTANEVIFSEQQIVDCDTTSYGCNGGFPIEAFRYVAKNGIEPESDYPYSAQDGSCKYNPAYAYKNVTSGGVAVNTFKNPNALKNAIYNQPVVVLVEADQTAW